jgi:TolB-like protein/Tfp pilus assembly protein PilF
MTGAFPCRRCGAPIPVPPEALASQTAALVCPGCGQRYTKKSGTGAHPKAASAPPTSAGFAAPVPPAAPGGAPPIDSASLAPALARAAPAHPAAPAGAAAALAPTTPFPEVLQVRERGAVFAEGERIANRYRIVRFIARGGMGEVYEAEDLELAGRVALKTIHSGAAEESGAVERFKREIQLARAVTHPNVCRIFDVGYHEVAPGAPPIVFLTMELLHGETLAARLKRRGAFAPAEALPLARQMAEALAAAHEAGVVHRDFKSENVFLVPAKGGGERAVVTDFGIARGGEEAGGPQLTSTGNVIGTPAYMAPEQIQGGPLGPAVDQYAFGVVLFEIVTGELPFQGDNPLATAARRLTEPPPSPRSLVPALDERWEAAILRCLEREPVRRFASVREVARALAGEPTTAVAALGAPAARRARTPAERRRRALAALLLVVLAGASVWAYLRVRAIRHRLDAGAPALARRSVAVLTLKNLAARPDAAWLSTALSEMLATEIARAGELRVLPGESVARALVELDLAGRDSLDAAARMRLRQRLGADYLVVGAYTLLPDGDGLRLDLRLEDARRSETIATVGENGRTAQLFDLVAKSGAGLRGALGADGGARAAARAALPASPAAARLYAEGLEALRRFEPQRGRELLERAVAIDPQNALARSALATAWSALGYAAKAEGEARRARELAAGLPVEDRLLVEARYFEAARSWAEAATIWEKLWSAYPDTAAYGLRLADCRTLAGQAEAALAVTAQLRNLPPPDGEDPRIDLVESAAAGALADYRHQADAAARASERAGAQGARLLAAEALVARGWALRNLGRAGEARAALERARSLYDEVGDRAGVSSADAALGGVLLDLGEPDNARAAYELALATARSLGDKGAEARALNNLAVLARTRGELEAARTSYEQVAALAAETGERVGSAFAANNLAAILAELGELPAAEARAEEALAVWRASGDKAGLGAALGNLGSIRRRQGRLAESERLFGESLELRRAIGQRPAEAVGLNGLAQTLLERGELAGAAARFAEAAALARELAAKSALAGALAGGGEVAAARGESAAALAAYSEAISLRRELGERAGVARLRAAVARLDLEANPSAAATAAREILALRPVERTPEVEGTARALLARALAALREHAAARDALASKETFARLPAALALDWRLAEARIALAEGRRVEARALATAVAAEAKQAGFLAAELEAALLVAESGAGERAEVARRARGAGFEALARRAESPSAL